MKYLAIGHVCEDLTPKGPVLGGSVAYAALTARYLGWNAKIITCANKFFSSLYGKEMNGVKMECRRCQKTTSFKNVHNGNQRKLFLNAKADQIKLYFPKDFFGVDLVHLAPVIDELRVQMIFYMPETCFVGVTPQGWLREVGSDGAILPKKWEERDMERVLKRADAVVLSIDDVCGDWNLLDSWAGQTKILAVTQGASGATVYFDGKKTPCAGVRVDNVIDPTGAGDVFAAAFFISLQEGKGPITAARLAGIVASQSIQYENVSFFQNQGEKK